MSFDYKWLADPLVFKVNRMEPHSNHIFYKDMEEVREGNSSFYHSLNGLWKFSYAKNYTMAIKEFFEKDYCCKELGI